MRRTLFGLPLLDVALALVLLVLKLITLGTGIQPGSGVVSYLAAPLWALPLAWRSRFPLAVAVAVMGAAVAEVGLGGFHNSVVALVVLLLVPYSLGEHSQSLGRLLAGLAVVVGAGGWIAVGPGGPTHGLGFLAIAGVALAPFLAGLFVRQLRLRAEALARLAEQLERERMERARTAVAEERERIARELHDEVAHAMSVIAVQADAAEGALARDPALVARPLLAIRETARESLADMRRVLGALRTDDQAELTPDSGLARLSGLIEHARAAGLVVELRIEGEPAPLPPALDLAAYRVLQEGLTNVRKHAAARRVGILLRYGRDAIGVEVTDDGDGSGTGGGAGRGLAGIRERVALLGGEFFAGPRARGFALRVTLPLT